MALREIVLASAIATASALGGCAVNPAPSSSYKISCDSTLNEDNPSEPKMGGLSMGMDDVYTLEVQGFEIYGGHAGGIGDTLQWTGCGGGIHLTWAFDNLMSVKLTQGWIGETSRGITLGDSRADFLAAYPEARQISYMETCGDECDRKYRVEHDKNYQTDFSFTGDTDTLEEITVRDSFLWQVQ